mmetsp:Transcript_4503/g.14955  ORF Transcript_4503/g.14955 Transcript_4503/m.14955 type:complete len:325 (+) Transcript_4503:45-1019(+)
MFSGRHPAADSRASHERFPRPTSGKPRSRPAETAVRARARTRDVARPTPCQPTETPRCSRHRARIWSQVMAPSWRCATSPSRRKSTVGRPCTRSSVDSAGALSESTLATRAAGPSRAAAAASCGPMSWQGPHHLAYTSTTRGDRPSASSARACVSESSATAPGRTAPVALKTRSAATAAARRATRSSLSKRPAQPMLRSASFCRSSETRRERSSSATEATSGAETPAPAGDEVGAPGSGLGAALALPSPGMSLTGKPCSRARRTASTSSPFSKQASASAPRPRARSSSLSACAVMLSGAGAVAASGAPGTEDQRRAWRGSCGAR